MPLITVIVPIYNSEKSLSKCIDSILSQTFTNFELILINDGSTDDSANICNKYNHKDKRVVVIHNQNHGVSASRNFGLENANGEYITFVDSDDYLSTDYLKHLFENQSDLTILGYSIFDAKGNFVSKNQYQEKHFTSKENIDWFDIFKGNMLHTPFAKLFKSEIIKTHNITFKENISCGEDTVFVVDYLNHISSLHILEYIDYFYIVSDNNSSLSSKVRPYILDEVSYSKEYCIEFFSKICPEKSNQIKRIYVNMIIWISIAYLRSLLQQPNMTKREKNIILETFLNNKYFKIFVENPTAYLHKNDPLTISVQRKGAGRIISKYNSICFKNKIINWFKNSIYDPVRGLFKQQR